MTATPSAEQLALAWRQLRGRGTCPDTLEAALRHPAWGPCLHGLAVSLSRRPQHHPHQPGAAAQAARRLGSTRQAPPTPTKAPPQPERRPGINLWSRRLPGAFDARKAAANDRE